MSFKNLQELTSLTEAVTGAKTQARSVQQIQAEIDKVEARISSMHKQGANVGYGDPLSQKLFKLTNELRKAKKGAAPQVKKAKV